jgi:hypothetical protein
LATKEIFRETHWDENSLRWKELNDQELKNLFLDKYQLCCLQDYFCLETQFGYNKLCKTNREDMIVLILDEQLRYLSKFPSTLAGLGWIDLVSCINKFALTLYKKNNIKETDELSFVDLHELVTDYFIDTSYHLKEIRHIYCEKINQFKSDFIKYTLTKKESNTKLQSEDISWLIGWNTLN